MLIKSKPERVIMVPKNAAKGKKVQNKAMVQFLPGYNDIDEKDWKSIENNCKKKLENGDMEILKIEDKAVTFQEVAQTDPEKAREVIAATYRIDTLEKWRKETPRDELRTEILNQIDNVKNHGKKKGS